MASDLEIDRALATVTATINDRHLSEFKAARVQQIVTESLGGAPPLTVDDGGGVHDETGARIAAIRRTDSGEWIAERQNEAAEGSQTPVPTAPRWSRLRKLLTVLHVRG